MTEPTTPAPAGTPTVSSIRRGMRVGDLKQSFIDNLACALGRGPKLASRHDLYIALALTVRDRVLDRSVETIRALAGPRSRLVAYLSAEFLPGPHLMNNLLNLGIVCEELLDAEPSGEIAAHRIEGVGAGSLGQRRFGKAD